MCSWRRPDCSGVEMFRPCIDLREGRVTQLVGGTLTDSGEGVRVHHVSGRPARWFAELYRRDGLRGGHVIQLDRVSAAAAREALAAYPDGMQVGGGIDAGNAAGWLEAGASHVIVTSWVFRDGRLDDERLAELVRAVGRNRLVLDLSCRRRGDDYYVVMDRWQRFTELRLTPETLGRLEACCAEFLVHGVDVEGLQLGIDAELVSRLASAVSIPATYAGGARSIEDLERVTRLGRGRIDLTIGSALDIFGGTGVRYAEAVAFNRAQAADGNMGSRAQS
jgi:phosphoribosylformimino-5-aminoimidazole carboxamide ribotide isomerase